jgi:RimJ/RimL family protein N-acetyltransferase
MVGKGTLMDQKITFRQAIVSDKPLISVWWKKPHVMEFWDNGPAMWNNVEHYLDNGVVNMFHYWIVSCDAVPFALLLSSEIDRDAEDLYRKYCDREGVTYTIDFMIGDEAHLGQGLAAPTLQAFMAFCPTAVTEYLIDPAVGNSRAVHVYEKAGFIEVGRYTPKEGSFAGKEHLMMRCKRSSC